MFLKLDIAKALEIGLIAIVFTFFFVDVFDNTGTLVGVAHKAGLVNPDGTLPRVKRALTVELHGRHGRRRFSARRPPPATSRAPRA